MKVTQRGRSGLRVGVSGRRLKKTESSSLPDKASLPMRPVVGAASFHGMSRLRVYYYHPLAEMRLSPGWNASPPTP